MPGFTNGTGPSLAAKCSDDGMTKDAGILRSGSAVEREKPGPNSGGVTIQNKSFIVIEIKGHQEMTVTLELELELEQGLQAQAQARGVTVEKFIHDLVSQKIRMGAPPVVGKRALNLPARNLGDMGSLHRRDIYDDAR